MSRPSWRWSVAAALAASAVAGYAAGCGGDTDGGSEREAIIAAFNRYIDAFRERDAERACAKLFLSTDLPEPLGDRLGLPTTGPHRASDWQKHFEECVRGFGDTPQRFQGKPRVRKVLRVVEGGPAAEDDGISASARLRAWTTESYPDPSLNTSSRWTFKLVKFDGDWKVVFEVR